MRRKTTPKSCIPWLARVALCTAGVVLASAASASASSTLRVPADFSTIQSAVNAANPGDTIKVAAGTFSEQVTIAKDLTLKGAGAENDNNNGNNRNNRDGANSSNNDGDVTTIKAPVRLVAGPARGRRNIVTIMGGAHVAMSKLRVAGPGRRPCDSPTSLSSGVAVIQDATLDLHSAAVVDIHNTPLLSCDHNGVAVRIGVPPFAPGATSGHATIHDVSVSNYTDGGIVLLGPGSTATIAHNRITDLAQTVNPAVGVGVNFGAVASVVGNTVTDNRCDSPDFEGIGCGPDLIKQYQSAGIVTSYAGAGTVIANNRLSNNDVGTYLLASPNCCSVNHNTLTGNRYFGDVIQDGDNSISHDRISGGQVGVGVAADSVDTTGTLSEVSISGTSIAPVHELSCCGFTAKAVVR